MTQPWPPRLRFSPAPTDPRCRGSILTAIGGHEHAKDRHPAAAMLGCARAKHPPLLPMPRFEACVREPTSGCADWFRVTGGRRARLCCSDGKPKGIEGKIGLVVLRVVGTDRQTVAEYDCCCLHRGLSFAVSAPTRGRSGVFLRSRPVTAGRRAAATAWRPGSPVRARTNWAGAPGWPRFSPPAAVSARQRSPQSRR